MIHSISAVNEMPHDEFIGKFGGIYEHSAWVAEQVAGLRPFDDPAQLSAAMRAEVDAASRERKMELIRAHPDLAGKLAVAGKLTPESSREQAGLGLDQLTDEMFGRFTALNAAYRERFGFPFIICARKHTRQSVLDAFEERLTHDRDTEISEAISQIHQIAGLRLADVFGEIPSS